MSRSAPLLLLAVACGGGVDVADAGYLPLDIPDQPLRGLDAAQKATFQKGDELFDLTLRDGDGLGPLYTAAACGACHDQAARGPGLVQKFSAVMADGVTPSPDQSRFGYGHTEHPLTTAGATTPILAPMNAPDVLVSRRVGPPVMGRGYLEAISDQTLIELAQQQATRDDGIHGRVNHVIYHSEPNPMSPYNPHQKGDSVVGRFGLKARIATLDEFTADALQGDMGITSPLRPTEILNPDGLTDDLKPGVDLTLASVNARADYMRLLAIPRRVAHPTGEAAFEKARCNGCHVSNLKTRADYPLPQLANVDAPVFTDQLLHDLGVGLADGLAHEDGEAGPRDWRTAPLIGLRFSKHYLHDSRADTVAEAIEAHQSEGSEANDSIARYRALSTAEQQALLEFVEAL
ncbi:MAG: hypothetical protein IPJ65_02375 [Archangiaceae bacterium]|nr:hypothetical protein [Archangiaceae bacterium]